MSERPGFLFDMSIRTPSGMETLQKLAMQKDFFSYVACFSYGYSHLKPPEMR